jgi:hypothetical protein
MLCGKVAAGEDDAVWIVARRADEQRAHIGSGLAGKEWLAGNEDLLHVVRIGEEVGDGERGPEGVGSEFADIFIRMLDDSVRYHFDLDGSLEPDREVYALDDEFLVNINALHGLIARVTAATEVCYEDAEEAFAGVLSFLRQMCVRYGIDLMAEYERKMAYNRTREHRHGGRRF